MFWKFNNPSSQIETVLAKEDVTLKELLEEDEIIHECKLQNKALVNFLTKPSVIEELVSLTIIEPSPELDEHVRFKYSNIACEILTSDVSALNEQIASNEALLAKLYQFIDVEPPLNPLLASFFSKIMGALIAKKTEQNWLSNQVTCLQVIDFLKAKQNFVSNLLKHLGTSAIMDLTLKLLTQVEGVALRQNILSWLDKEELVQSIVALLSPSVDSDRHSNVAQLLCDFLKTARDNIRNSQERTEPDLLLNTLQTPATLSSLLEHMLNEPKTESCIVGGIQVLLAVLDINKNSGDDLSEIESNQAIIESTTLAIVDRLADFHALLKDPPKKQAVSTTFGVLSPPLGNTRLHIVKLLTALISKHNPKVLKELISLGTTQVLLDLFFEFQWNNFLHLEVKTFINYAIRAQVFSETGDDNALYHHLIIKCNLVERILNAWKDNETEQQEKKCPRKGYMGHLGNIAIDIADLCTSSPLGQFISDNLPNVAESFNKFNENTLSEIRRTHELLLGGVSLNVHDEDVDDYVDVTLNETSILHQPMYMQFQDQQLMPQEMDFNYSDLYDQDLIEDNDTLQTIDHRTGMNFDLSEGDLVHQHELFKQVCAQNINTLDDADDQIFEERDHTYQTIIEKQPGSTKAVVYSSDSEDDDLPPIDDPFATSESWFSSNGNFDAWSSGIKDKDSEEGWTNFNSFATFDADFDTMNNAANDLTLENVEEFNNQRDTDFMVMNFPNLKVETLHSDTEPHISGDETKTKLPQEIADVTEAPATTATQGK